MMPRTESEVQSGSNGLRITLPNGHEGRRQGVGVSTDFGVKGDFDITLRFEMLQEPEPRDTVSGGTGLSMRVDLENSSKDLASLSRVVQPNDTTRFTSFGWKNVESKVTHFKAFSTKAKKGRLRLVRTGAVLAYYAAEEASDDFVFLFEHPFGEEDLKRVCIAGGTGGPKASVDIRVTDFRIRADSIPRMPATNAATPVPPAHIGSQSTGHWLVALLVVLGGIFCSAMLLGIWLFLRRGPRPDAPTARAPKDKPAKPKADTSIAAAPPATKNTQTKSAVSAASVVFQCSACGKKIKVKTAHAGRRVKCPHCGTAELVPDAEAEQA
jgi:DNA-directed RNA polymerase subunit RPC12/RpoP